jgi:murein DD-endopeptidase MepM/ murein hydrolase activator NlpD
VNTEYDKVQNTNSSIGPADFPATASSAKGPPAPTWRFDRFLILGLAGIAMVCGSADIPVREAAGRPDDSAKLRVRLVTHRDGGVIYFSVENNELAEVTGFFNVELLNLKSTVGFPHRATFPPGRTTAAFSLAPLEAGRPSDYSFTNYYILGTTSAVHDDCYRYSLPYSTGSAFRVTQGYGGKFSHQGSNRHAIDWRMPVGTPVRAARGGLVVKVRDGSDTGGAQARFACFNNYVLIRHDDGTLGQYCHLKKGGVTVHEGDRVTDGDTIALSGNTGFSSGPHLHFSVYKIKDANERESLPVQFKTAEAQAITLKAGDRYTALRPTVDDARRRARESSTAAGSAGS